MHYSVVDARHVSKYVIWFRFADGSEGEVDLAGELWGKVFEPLNDLETFRSFRLTEYGTIEWPNGADIASELFYEKAHVTS